jgi:phytanoyl-CoA hydroxylase
MSVAAGLASRPLGPEFARDGFAVVPNFLSAEQCAALIERAEQLAERLAPEGPRSSVFTTVEQARISDAWFLGSGGTIRCFFEAGAGELAAARAVNKIGHALHDLDPVYAAASYDPRLPELARAAGLSRPLAIQSMIIFKNPGIGGEVGVHQDACFLYTEPQTVVGFWIALEEATTGNGCLHVAPGGHRGPLRQRFRRAERGGTEFVDLDRAPLPTVAELLPLPVAAGTLVLLHGNLPHWSGPNLSSRRRLAYALHCIDAGAHYPDDNWLRRDPLGPPRPLDAGPPI